MQPRSFFAALAFAALTAGPASATLTTYLTIANEAAIPVGPAYATVTVQALSNNQVQFTVDADQTLLLPGGNFGIQAFGFNYDSVATGAIGGSLPAGWSINLNQNMDGFGSFEIEFTGTGGTRLDPLVFTVTTTNTFGSAAALEAAFFEANASNYHYAAHIAGFTNFGTTNSSFFADGDPTNPAPEPMTIALLGMGLAGLGLVRRKRG